MKDIDLQNCPICNGSALMEEEGDWCVYVTCMDCGAHTAEFPYKNKKEKEEAQAMAAKVWSMGKVIQHNPGE